jgi:hypothetical protein
MVERTVPMAVKLCVVATCSEGRNRDNAAIPTGQVRSIPYPVKQDMVGIPAKGWRRFVNGFGSYSGNWRRRCLSTHAPSAFLLYGSRRPARMTESGSLNDRNLSRPCHCLIHHQQSFFSHLFYCKLGTFTANPAVLHPPVRHLVRSPS